MPATKKNGMRKSMKKQQQKRQQQKRQQQKKQQRKSMKKGGARRRRTQRKVMKGGASFTKDEDDNKTLTLTLDEPYENDGENKHNIVIVQKSGAGYVATMPEYKGEAEVKKAKAGLNENKQGLATQEERDAKLEAETLTSENKRNALESALKYKEGLNNGDEKVQELDSIITNIERATKWNELEKYVTGNQNTDKTYPNLRRELMKLKPIK